MLKSLELIVSSKGMSAPFTALPGSPWGPLNYRDNELLDDQTSVKELSEQELCECIGQINRNECHIVCLRNRSINENQITRLMEAIKLNNTVNTLELPNCRLNDKAAVAIASLIQYNDSITSVDLSNNEITVAGMLNLIESLRDNFKIIYFNCDGNFYAERPLLDTIDSLVKRNVDYQNEVMDSPKHIVTAVTLADSGLIDTLTKITIEYSRENREVVPEAQSKVKELYAGIITWAYTLPPAQKMTELDKLSKQDGPSLISLTLI